MVKYTQKLFLISLVLTVIIFVAGLLLGFTLDDYRSNTILSNIQRNELETESYLVHESLIQSLGGDKCEILNARITDMERLVNAVGQQLASFDERKTFGENLDYLKRKYILSEVKFFILISDLKESCNNHYVPILFFYTKDDRESINQGYVLTDLSKQYENKIIVLSIDKDYADEPIVNTLKLKFNVTEPTTLIINGRMKKDGFTGKEELEDILVNLF